MLMIVKGIFDGHVIVTYWTYLSYGPLLGYQTVLLSMQKTFQPLYMNHQTIIKPQSLPQLEPSKFLAKPNLQNCKEKPNRVSKLG